MMKSKEKINITLEIPKRVFVLNPWCVDDPHYHDRWIEEIGISDGSYHDDSHVIIDKNGEPVIIYDTFAMGDNQPYYLGDYGKTWAWRIEDFEDFADYRLSDNGRLWELKKEDIKDDQ